MDRRDKLIEAGLALSAELSLPVVLQRIIELAAEVTGARYAALGVLGPGGRIVEFVTHGVAAEERAAIGDPPTGRGILGVLIEEVRPLRIPDIAADPRSVGFPPNHPLMRSFLGAPVVARGRVFGNIYLTEKQDAPGFTEEDERSLVVLAAQAAVAVENAGLYEEVRQRERWLDAVAEITTAILTGAGPSQALTLIASRGRELLSADLATVAIPAGPDDLVLEVADGMHAEELRGVIFPIDGSISGEVVRTGRPVVLTNASEEPRAYQPVAKLGEMGPAVFVPLSARGSPFGTLGAANLMGGRPFGEPDVRVLEAFAGHAALALEFARAQDEMHRLAVLEDRERIARELHDGVIQSLFAVGMGLQGAAMMSADEELARRIEGAIEEVDRVIRDLRSYIFGLRPGILADREFDRALQRLAEEFQERSGVLTVTDVDHSLAAELAPHAAELVQLAREALSNVGRHAEATTCRLMLYRDHGAAVLEVDDDGKGFDVGASRRGYGLTNLEERAMALGGRASIDSEPGRGTTVRILLPL